MLSGGAANSGGAAKDFDDEAKVRHADVEGKDDVKRARERDMVYEVWLVESGQM